MKELNEAYFDLGLIEARCEDTRTMISAFVGVFLDLAPSSAAVGVRIDIKIPAMPMPSASLLERRKTIPRISRFDDLCRETKIAELDKARALIAEFDALHRERCNLSYALQCAHADHMAKLWQVGYTIKNRSVVPL